MLLFQSNQIAKMDSCGAYVRQQTIIGRGREERLDEAFIVHNINITVAIVVAEGIQFLGTSSFFTFAFLFEPCLSLEFMRFAASSRVNCSSLCLFFPIYLYKFFLFVATAVFVDFIHIVTIQYQLGFQFIVTPHTAYCKTICALVVAVFSLFSSLLWLGSVKFYIFIRFSLFFVHAQKQAKLQNFT